MRWYVAARYGRHPEMQDVAKYLKEHAPGHEVRARWIVGNDNLPDEQCAMQDFDDVVKSDGIINFTEGPGNIPGRSRGGRHVEFGLGLALNKRVVVIGPRENVFHYLPGVEVYESLTKFVEQLLKESQYA